MPRSELGGLLLVAIGLSLVSCGRDDGPLERARDLVERDSGFGTAIEAGDTFAHIGELLLQAADECDAQCHGLREASAFTQIVAVEVLGCTQPGIHDARVAVRDHLDAVIASPSTTGALPEVPTC